MIAALRAQTEAVTMALALDEVSHSAHLDPLTQLPDRLLLLDRFAHAMAAARRRGHRLALLFVDLDGFKQINDTLGHAAGDGVLKRMANRLLSSVRAVDTVSRRGGDEFLILLDEVSHPHDAAQIADKLIAALDAPIPVGDQLLRLTASIGISIYPRRWLRCRRADRASGRRYVSFEGARTRWLWLPPRAACGRARVELAALGIRNDGRAATTCASASTPTR